jgi:hypothetical protein
VPNHRLDSPDRIDPARTAYARNRPAWRVAPLAIAGAVAVTALMDVALDSLPRVEVEFEEGRLNVQLATGAEARGSES